MGITGWIHHTRDLRDERPTVNEMAAALTPAPLRTDAVRLARHTGLAHRGLAGGYADWRRTEHPDPDLAVVFDGTLTNRRHVEEQLYQRPRPLSSDAEVLLHAYRAWGAGMVQHIDGTYTIALWDNHVRQLLLIRDPLGAKTVFYTLVDGGLVFASRATALLAHPNVKPVVDTDGLNELITLAGVRTPGHGVLHGVTEVLPGQLVRYTPAGVRSDRYWSLEPEDHGEDVDTTTTFVRCALAENTADLRAGSAGAVLLSGGVASTAAAAFITGTGEYRPTAWTLTLTEPDIGPSHAGVEVGEACRATRHLQLHHTGLVADADVLHRVADSTRRIRDFPGESDLDATLYLLLCTIARGGATQVVTGDGADAVFGGYPWLLDPDSLAQDDLPWQPAGVGPADVLTIGARRHLLPGRYRTNRYIAAAESVQHLPGDDVIARRHRTLSNLTLTHYLPHLLTRLGELAEAAGLTVHTPFADWLLAQHLYNTPVAVRHLCGVPNGLLRHTVADLLPPQVTWQPSTPFPRAHQLSAWRDTKRAQLLGILDDPAAPLRPLLDRRKVTDLFNHPPTTAAGDWHRTVAYLIELDDWLARHHITLT